MVSYHQSPDNSPLIISLEASNRAPTGPVHCRTIASILHHAWWKYRWFRPVHWSCQSSGPFQPTRSSISHGQSLQSIAPCPCERSERRHCLIEIVKKCIFVITFSQSTLELFHLASHPQVNSGTQTQLCRRRQHHHLPDKKRPIRLICQRDTCSWFRSVDRARTEWSVCHLKCSIWSGASWLTPCTLLCHYSRILQSSLKPM